jgi:hypothetical protein
VELSDIKKSVSNCSDEELRSMLMEIRQSRRTSKRAPAQARVGKARPEASVDALMSAMSPEQIAMLLKQMGG